eukprot:Rmarinus@m.2473
MMQQRLFSLSAAYQDPLSLAKLLVRGDRLALSRGITLTESTRPADHERAISMMLEIAKQRKLTNSPKSAKGLETFRVGISGPPGAGKSTLIEALGMGLVERGHRVAVVAVDPSSCRSGGSILGDKTRMANLSRDPRAYVRPSPTSGTLGGVARRTNEVISLCEAAGYDVVLVETVGVGQSEQCVADMVDAVMLLINPSAGDELQGVKRGILEIADLIVVNKADGDMLPSARRTMADYLRASNLLPRRFASWVPRVLLCSSVPPSESPLRTEATGASPKRTRRKDALSPIGVWDSLLELKATVEVEMVNARRDQQVICMQHDISDGLMSRLRHDHVAMEELRAVEPELKSGRILPRAAASRVIDRFLRQ